VIFLLDTQSLKREKKNTDLLCSLFKAEKRKGTSSSQGQTDKWERFKRRNRQRARIFHRREKGGMLAALSNCIPTFAEGEGWGGQRSGERDETRKRRETRQAAKPVIESRKNIEKIATQFSQEIVFLQ